VLIDEEVPVRQWKNRVEVMSIVGGCSFIVLAALIFGLMARGMRRRIGVPGIIVKKSITRYSPIAWIFKDNVESNETSDDILKAGYGSGSLDDSSYRRPPPILIMPSEISLKLPFEDHTNTEKDIEAVSLHQGYYSPIDSPSSSGVYSISSSPKTAAKSRLLDSK
jgi:hypothetical protein